MDCCPVLVVLLLAVGCMVQETSGRYNRRYYSRGRGRMYAGSRYKGFHSGYKNRGGFSGGLRTIFTPIYFKNTVDNNNPINTVDNNVVSGGGTRPVVIQLPTSLTNNPNFKIDDLPFYLASGLFDPNNLGSLGGGAPNSVPKPIVDPIFGNILGGSNTNLLGGGAANNFLGGANTNILGGANTNVLGGADPNFLGGSGSNVFAGANTNVLGGGSGLLAQNNPNTDFFSPKTGGTSDPFGAPTLTG